MVLQEKHYLRGNLPQALCWWKGGTHVKAYKNGVERSHVWLGLSLTHLHLPGFDYGSSGVIY